MSCARFSWHFLIFEMSLSRKRLKISASLEWGTSEHISESDSLGIDLTESESDDEFGGHCQKLITMLIIYYIFKNSCITDFFASALFFFGGFV